ncbi:DUF1559 domain-containing protein [Roseiconus lacunae]|uniref:DUF1559 domain-containing protein n=1 Tax=Roseiconus lacunae TaxID=2605694 RepID=A0ABT7PSM3_9BACT|nr:DUF1559 domain-containing protein [Roseiconus lacunae]MDM4019498.1 DUF1559 domain-containing protein [Roseiconus lacunae]
MRRRAITFIELLIVIGIVAIIFAFAFPAVQSARESSRRIQCQNNTRQTLIGIQSHHTTFGALPSFYNGTKLSYPLREWDLFHMHSWRVPLLPYVEQSALKETIAWDLLATESKNLEVAQTIVPTFICPSGNDPSEMGWGAKHGAFGTPFEQLTDHDKYRVVRSDYDAMAGIQKLPDLHVPDGDSIDYVTLGIWGWPVFSTGQTSNSRLSSYRQGKFRDVRDGLSNTIAIVERTGKPIEYTDGRPDTSSDPNANYPGQVGWSASNSYMWSINGNGIGVNDNNARGIYSFHAGGAYVGMADGAVRFLSESTDYETLIHLYGRSDGGLPERIR